MAVQMYFTAIVLPDGLNEEVLKLKHFMREKWGCTVGLKSPAHITLTPPFWMEEEKAESLIHAMDGLSETCIPFTIHTNNFSAFKPRTIFIATAPDENLNRVKRAVDAFFQNHPEYKVKKETRPFHPHITIATRDLHKRAFYEAWPLFEAKEFKAGFVAEGIATLRHNKKNWDVLHTSYFGK